MRIQGRPLNNTETKQFEAYTRRGMTMLGLVGNSDAEPTAIVNAVDTFVDKWQEERSNPLKKLFKQGPDSKAVALELGAVWGNQIVRVKGWEWIYIQLSVEVLYAVASPKRSLLIYPASFIKSCFDDPKKDCTIMLSFNMMIGEKLPRLPAGGHVDFMPGVHRIVSKR